MTDKNKPAEPSVTSVELIEIPASFAEFALAAGLAHDASKGDVLAKQAKDRAEAEAARVTASKLLEEVGAKTPEEAIGKLTAERATLDELVKAITGDDKATAQDAIAKLATERKANEGSKARALIEAATASGKTAGDKAFELFEKHGMAALEAHLDALVPHGALTTSAPKQKDADGGAKPAVAAEEGEIVVKLTTEEKAYCERHGIDVAAFTEARKSEIALERDNRRKRDS